MGSTFYRRLIFFCVLIFSYFLIYQIINCLGELKDTVRPEIYLNRSALCLFGFFLCIVGGWYAFGFPAGLGFSFVAAILTIFVMSFTHSQSFIWFLPEYGFLGFVLFKIDQNYTQQISLAASEREKFQIEKNDLTASYKSKGEAISMLFEKYSTYYNMRKLAEELASTITVSEIAQIVVNRCMDFILRGDVAVLSLFQSSGRVPVIAAREYGQKDDGKSKKSYESDGFDQWVIKNRKQLIIMDTHQDFRFDAREAQQNQNIRSVIISPLIQNENVIGTLRIHSSKSHTFVTDDLRLLDTVAVLAGSALSNAILYEQTEDLAIKDSLTGLYVRRYFFDRFKEEHRRALITKKSLSVLICDLDHFKSCNDKYGHAVGDMILLQFSRLLGGVAEGAIVCRYGGEEFTVLLPETTKKEAIAIAEDLRARVEREPVIVRRESIVVTVSIGVASMPDDSLDMESLIEKADQALYEAKRKGRNQVC